MRVRAGQPVVREQETGERLVCLDQCVARRIAAGDLSRGGQHFPYDGAQDAHDHDDHGEFEQGPTAYACDALHGVTVPEGPTTPWLSTALIRSSAPFHTSTGKPLGVMPCCKSRSDWQLSAAFVALATESS